MGTLGRLTGFVIGLALVFAAAVAAGSWWGPAPATPVAHEDEPAHASAAGHDPDDDASADHLPGGLMRSQDGYSLELTESTAVPGAGVPLSFTVTGPDGSPHTAYDVEHGKRLHLIVVRRDLTGYQHVHPRLDPGSGTWSTEVDLAPGTWRVFADFAVTDGPALTLGTDLTVPGRVPPVDPVEAETTTTEVDGYTVELAGDVVAARDAELTLTVSRDGRPVTDLQPYLGAYGHLVALRDGDLAYLHVHPHDSDDAGPDIRFTAEVPSRGRYRLFLDFRHEDQVRTATFDVTAVQR
jgi:hypothetical protein